MQAAAEIIAHIVHESGMHVGFCESWGISKAELERTPESSVTMAYGTYILNIGLTGKARASLEI
jgi:thiaminase